MQTFLQLLWTEEGAKMTCHVTQAYQKWYSSIENTQLLTSLPY